jgi:hypothetical protein
MDAAVTFIDVSSSRTKVGNYLLLSRQAMYAVMIV